MKRAKKTVWVSAPVTPEMLAEIEAEALLRDIAKAQVVRMAIRAWLREQRHQAAQALELAF